MINEFKSPLLGSSYAHHSVAVGKKNQEREGNGEMKDVTDLKGSYLVERAYVEAYKTRYGVTPITNPHGSDALVLKDLTKQVGVGRATELVKHYVSMSDEWFVRTGHSLETFKKSIPQVNADLGRSRPISKQLELRLLQQCAQCGKYNVFILPGTNMEKMGDRFECDECTAYK